MNKWSDLSFKAQEEVDAVIKAKGLGQRRNFNLSER